MQEININDIQPAGNFKDILLKFRAKADTIIEKSNSEKQYNPALAKFIKVFVAEFGVIDALEQGIVKKDCWNNDEAKMCALYSHLILIDVNQTAHTYLNPGVKFESRAKQLEDCIKEKTEVYGKLRITE